jgi:hypothetical protein
MEDDSVSEQTKENFFRYQRCAWCHSTEQLELDRVNPKQFQTDDIWKWETHKRELEIKNECQVLCGPCYRRKKSMWKQFRIANEPWYQAMPS